MPHLPTQLAELARELPITLTKEQAMDVLKMSERNFARVVRRGDLVIMKSGHGRSGRVIVTRSEVLRYMTERMVTA